jgi:hypothetical protein
MGAVVQGVIRLALTLFAGWGIGKAADKVLPDKVPYYPAEGISEGLNPKKIVWLIIVSAIAAMVIKFVGKKLNIKLLK